MRFLRDRIFKNIFVASALATLVVVLVAGWVAVHQIEENAAIQQFDATSAATKLYIALVAAGFVSFTLCFVVALAAAAIHQSQASPILNAAQAMAAGDDRMRIVTERDDELGRMAEMMNLLAERRSAILRESESQQLELRTILDHASDAIIVISEAGRILLMNGAARMMFHAPPDATGRLFIEVTRDTKIQEFLGKILNNITVQRADIVIQEEEMTVFRVRGSRIPDSYGREERILLIASDISDLRRVERMRIDFVANASHEIKTPLSAILGYAETLHDEPDLDLETRQNFLETIIRNSRRLEELVRDMLHLSKLDSTGAAFRYDSVDFYELCSSAVESMREVARRKNIYIDIHRRGGDCTLIAEKELVYQCVSNLVSNAVKFTPEDGRISIDIAAGDAGVFLDVTDTGPGIAPEHLSRIFERFYRADPARARAAGGTGLGLAIVKHAVLLHGGRVDVESEPGEGSKFRVFLPYRPPGVEL